MPYKDKEMRRWVIRLSHRKRKMLGLCQFCNGSLNLYRTYCDECAKIRLEEKRRVSTSSKFRPSYFEGAEQVKERQFNPGLYVNPREKL